MHTNLNLGKVFFYLLGLCVVANWVSFFCCCFLGVNCSEVIGKENCDRICENGRCVQVSPTSFRCTCDTGVSGKKLLFRWLLVKFKCIVCHYDNEGYHTVVIPDRGIIHRQSVFLNAVHPRQWDRFYRSSQFQMRNHVICLKGATIFRKVKPENYKSHISWKDQHFLMGLKPVSTWCYICHHNIWSAFK